MFSSVKKRALVVFAALVFVGSIGLNVSAQQQGGSGLVISPTRTELEIAPGGTQKIRVSLKNVSGVDITAKAEINDFESDNRTGDPKIFPSIDKHTAASVRNFLTNVADVPLKKDEKKDFDINLAVPANASPGAYYGIVRYSAVPVTGQAEGDNQISLTASVGTLILLTVPGDIKEQIQVQSVKVENVDSEKKPISRTFFTTKPEQSSVEIKNNGNGFSKPFGRVTLSKGSKEVYAYELNGGDQRSNILPNSTRIFTNKLENIKNPGRYKLSANVSHGSGGELITSEVSFWYIPAWCFYVFAALLLTLIAVVYAVYRRKFGKPTKKQRKRRNS